MQREISRNHTSDWDEQRERLSAYLDGELNEDERVALEQHLPTCEQCQRALDDLREVRTLLRAMPIPTPPRSFAIPTEGAIPMPLAASASGRAERADRRSAVRSGSRWSGVAQALGGFVAAAGVILVLGSSILGTRAGIRFSNASTASSGAASSNQSAHQDQHATTSTANSSTTTSAKAATPTQAVNATSAPTPPARTGGEYSPTATSGEHTYATPVYPADLPIVPIGGGMIAGGAIIFVVGRVSGRRARRM